MTMNKPLVSVIMPVYNGEKYIRKAVESVYEQGVSLELLVIDDGSTDHTEEVLSAYEGREDFRYIKNEQNMGAAGSRNRGVGLAQGTYIAFLDADDWWEPGKLKEQLKRLEETGYVLCSTGRELMKADGSSTGRTIPVKEKITYRELLKHNSINCSSVILRRDVAREFPMEHDDSHEDYITWLKILRKYGCAAGINKPYLKISSQRRRQIQKQTEISSHDLQCLQIRRLRQDQKLYFFLFLCCTWNMEILLLFTSFTVT